MIEIKYNLAGNCVYGLDDPYFRRNVCSDATEMAGIVDEDANEFLLSDEFIQKVNWPHSAMGSPSDNIYEFAYNQYKDIYWAYNIEDDIHFFFVKDSINENYRDTITVRSIKLTDLLEEILPEHKGEYVYIGTCMNSFDEYGECIHDAFYDEEHFFNSWGNANEISKEEFWSNIDPSSDKYDEVKELEADPEYPAEYRYNPDDDVYFIFVSDDTHYFFVNPNSYENIKDAEEDSYDMNLQENIQRIKKIMGIYEGYSEVNMLPGIVDQIYDALEQNDIYLENVGGRDNDHYMIRCKHPYDFELYIKLNASSQPYIHTHFYDGVENNHLEFIESEIPDFIDYVLSHKEIFLPFDEAVAEHNQELNIDARDNQNQRMGG